MNNIKKQITANEINYLVQQYKQDIYNIINKYSDLPASLIYYILKDIFKDIQSTYINNLYKNRQKKQQQGEED